MQFNGNYQRIRGDQYLLRRWDIKPVSSLNARYFSLPVVEYSQLNSAGNIAGDEFTQRVELSLDKTNMTVGCDEIFHLPVEIAVRSGVLGSSAERAIRLSYHWKLGDTITIWDGLRTPLEIDISNRHRQPVTVEAPAHPGEYILIVDMVMEDVSWLGQDLAIPVRVK